MRKKGDIGKNRTGETYITNEGYNITIIEFFSADNCSVLFENGYISKEKTYSCVRRGQIKNPYHNSVYGVGFFGEGSFVAKSENNIKPLFYLRWTSMLRRCYDSKVHEVNPKYTHTTVCKEWHNFQVFAKWYNENYNSETMQGWHLDKDILAKGNNIYSPKTCCLIPMEINNIFVKNNKNRGDMPIGVTKKDKWFYSTMFNAKQKKFKTSRDAFEDYKFRKEEKIKMSADKWKDKISEKTYDAMHNYKVEITD